LLLLFIQGIFYGHSVGALSSSRSVSPHECAYFRPQLAPSRGSQSPRSRISTRSPAGAR
jgi:hypothetical protein